MPKLKSKKILAVTSLFIFLGMFFVFTSNVDAITYEAQIGFGKYKAGEAVPITPDSIGEYITEIYKYAVGVVGILASIVIMWGGVRWLTAGGDSGAVDDAKKWIEGALSGLVLVMTSYMILYFVNPDLIKFKSIKIDEIKTTKTTNVTTGCCANDCVMRTTNEKRCVCNNNIESQACAPTGPYKYFLLNTPCPPANSALKDGVYCD